MHPSLRQELDRIFTGYHGVFTSRLPDNDVRCIRQIWIDDDHILGLVEAVHGTRSHAVMVDLQSEINLYRRVHRRKTHKKSAK